MLRRLGTGRGDPCAVPAGSRRGGGTWHGHDATFAEDYALAQQVFGEHHGHAHSHSTTTTTTTTTISMVPVARRPAMTTTELVALLHSIAGVADRRVQLFAETEAALDANLIHDAESARDWIASGLTDVLAHGELPFLAHQLARWHARRRRSSPNAWFIASRESAELRRETEQMGWSLAQLCASLEWGDGARRSRRLRRSRCPPRSRTRPPLTTRVPTRYSPRTHSAGSRTRRPPR